MILPDVNVLVYAHRRDAADHHQYHSWLESTINSGLPFAMSDLVLSGFLRVVTHPRVFKEPSAMDEALPFVEQLRDHPDCINVRPGSHHWGIFERLCKAARARGNLVADAFLAAIAIEHGCEWITTDGDFARFADLKWRHPLR